MQIQTQARENIVKALAGTRLGEGLARDTIMTLAASTRIVYFDRRELIIAQGSAIQAPYIVAKGLVKESRLHVSGRQRVVRLHGQGLYLEKAC